MARMNCEVSSFAVRALLVGAFGISTASCGFLPKKVTKKDCEKWGEHFAQLAKNASDGELKKCGEDKAAQKMVKNAMDEAADSIKEEIVKGCGTQEGKSYIAKDADCYLKATKMTDWKTCNFQTPFFTDFATQGESIEKSFKSSCEAIEKAKGASSGAAGSKADRQKRPGDQ